MRCGNGLSENPNTNSRHPCYCDKCGLQQEYNDYALSDAEKSLYDD